MKEALAYQSPQKVLSQLFQQCAASDVEAGRSPKAQQALAAFAQATRIKPNVAEGFYNPLSFKELLVLMLNGAGHSGREIAAILGLTPLTVQKYEWRTRRKLKTTSRIHSFCEAIVRGYLVILP